jgi:predicted transcriptional regulator of viral defense system
MNAIEAVSRLRKMQPAITTADAAMLLGQSVPAAGKMLARLARSGLVTPIRRGLWAIGERVEPLTLPPYLTAPLPSYTSLQTALYLHGMISQMPSVIYVASLDRTQLIETSVGTFSIHRLAPEFFGGFETDKPGVALATPEKALLDVFYLSATVSRRFAALPELELPAGFRVSLAREWVRRIRSARLRTIVSNRLESVLDR